MRCQTLLVASLCVLLAATGLSQAKQQPRTRPHIPTQQAEQDRLCRDMGQVAYSVAVGRDQGILASEHLQALYSIPTPNPQIQAFMRVVTLNVHLRPWETPFMAQHRVEANCLAVK